jgi:aspartyl-tRNA(Asn)/glutamyl-tRNA(Gln) amidotransferase subunit A
MKQLTRREFASVSAKAAALCALAPAAKTFAAETSMPAPEDTVWWTVSESADAIRNRTVTSTQLTQALLDRVAIYNPKLNAYITVMRDNALAQAKQLDFEQRSGKLRGPLHGVPIALKDNIDTAGTRTTAASKVFENRVPTEDAEVVTRLKAAGAVILGKLNLHEFALGGTTDISYWGPARNPWALDHVTGGSSGGSGAAVAGGLCAAALGTDTGGSIRIPSSWCGIAGLKGTYGLVSIRGIIPCVYSLDHCGPMARSVDDLALMLTAMAGYDELDNASVDHPKEDYIQGMQQPISGIRLGTPPEFYDNLDPEVRKAMQEAVAVLSKMTQGVTSDASLPSTPELGMFFGMGEMQAYHEPYLKASPMSYRAPTRTMLQAAQPASAADYIRGRSTLEQLRRTVDHAFAGFDLVVLPTERQMPPTINDSLQAEMKSEKPKVYGFDTSEVAANTAPFDVYGLPAATIPCGFNSAGLPIGLTIAGPRFSESKILAVAKAYEQATDWHKRKPTLTPETVAPPVEG